MARPILCVVFAKPPRPGQAKTRLGASLGLPDREGADAAARIARALLADTLDALLAAGDALTVVLSTPEPSADHGLTGRSAGIPRWDQGDGELGARLARAFRRGLDEAARVVALGADGPGLPGGHLDALSGGTAPAALGRCPDGGFWGLRLDVLPEGALLGLPYSTDRAADAVEADLRSRGLDVASAPSWFDVDVASDLRRLRSTVPRGDAPATHLELDRLGWPQ